MADTQGPQTLAIILKRPGPPGGLADSTQAMSWFTVGGNAGIALGPAIVTPVLLVTRLRGNAGAAGAPAVVVAAVLGVRRPWRAPEVTAREAWPSRSAGLATPLFGNLADSGGLTTALAGHRGCPGYRLCAVLPGPRSPSALSTGRHGSARRHEADRRAYFITM